MRYLGSKARILNDLAPLIGEPDPDGSRFVDAFSGTGVVASMAADLGWGIHVNDHLYSAKLLSSARLLAISDVSFSALGGYPHAVSILNRSKPVQGFLWREYSPASANRAPRPRRYFTEKNAAQLDGMRGQVHTWRADGNISSAEEHLLLADLIEAASSIANTAGTFGCFLSGWSPTALRPAQVTARPLRSEPVCFSSGELDVFDVGTMASDTVYLDPPYTKRQYAAYYHILETLARGDQPLVSGVTGLRPWRPKASVFCYKRHALSAMLRLVGQIHANRVLISYSAEGHIDLETLVSGLEPSGTVEVHAIGKIPRYQPNGLDTQHVEEFVIEVNRGVAEA